MSLYYFEIMLVFRFLFDIDFFENYCCGVVVVDCVLLLEIMVQSKGFFDDIKKEIECLFCEE